MSWKKAFLPAGILCIVVLWGACVDIPSDPGTNVNPDFRSLARFVHAVPGGPAGAITVDGTSIGTLSFGQASTYSDLPAGSRRMGFASTPARLVSLASEEQSTVLVYVDPDSVRYLNLGEGRYDRNNGVAGVALVRFANVAPAGPVSFKKDSAAGSNLSAGVAFASVQPYTSLAAGTYTIVAVSDSAVATLPPANFQAGRMYTVISTGRGASFQMLQFADRQPGLTKPGARDPGGEAGTPRKDR